MIPFDTHVMIQQACYPLSAGLRSAYAGLSVGARLRQHASKLPQMPVDFSVNTIWIFKGTKADLAFSARTRYIILDHVRRTRSEPIHSLDAALKARAAMLKDIEAYEDARRQEADALAKTLGLQEAEE